MSYLYLQREPVTLHEALQDSFVVLVPHVKHIQHIFQQERRKKSSKVQLIG